MEAHRVKLISILRSIYRELRHYDFGPGVSVRKSDTWSYIMEIARRNRMTSMQNCLSGTEWPRIAETYLIYTQSSRIYGDMLEKRNEVRGGKTIIDAIKAQSKASSVLFELKRKKCKPKGNVSKVTSKNNDDEDNNKPNSWWSRD